MALRVHHLLCSPLRPVAGFAVNGQGRLVCHCLLVETESGLVVVDTAVAKRDLERPRERLGWEFDLFGRPEPEGLAVIDQVVGLGLDPADVRHIVLTHLDLDHAGGLVDFPQARVHVLGAEHRAGEARRGVFARARYKPELWAHDPKWELYEPSGETWNGLQAVRELRGLPPEILLVPLAGHSLGHAGIAVESERGWLLHAGDAYFHHGELEPKRRCSAGLRFFQWLIEADRRERFANQARLRELNAAGAVQIFSAHDPYELERLQQNR